MVDIHTHILHGIDDGAETFDEAMEMLEVAFSNGTTDLVLTPHYLSNDLRSTGVSKADILKRFEDLRSAAESKFDGLKLYIGAETFAAANILECAETDALLPINNTRYLLLEFGFDDTVSRALTVTRELHRLGYIAIVAHPERYAFVHEDTNAILRMKRRGCLLQINKGSIKGSFGKSAYYISRKMISKQLADFVASDAHSPYMRTPFLHARFFASKLIHGLL